MDVVEKRITEAVKEHETYLGDFLGLDVHGADGLNLSCAGKWFKGELGRLGIVGNLASDIEKLFIRHAGSVLARAPEIRKRFAAMESVEKSEVSDDENRD